jgi:DUF4097 and DUF4098 domain-containing protein YvlB
LVALTWDTAAQDADASFERTVKVEEAAHVDVHTGSGSITVRPGKSSEVHVVGRLKFHRGFFASATDEQEIKRRFESDPPIEVSGSDVRIGPRTDDDRLYRNVSMSFVLEIPADAALKAHTGSGSADIEKIGGPVEASTGSGSIDLRDVGGPVAAHSGSGQLRAEGVRGGFDGDTGSGSILVVQSAPGDVNVSAGSGSIDLRGLNGALRARSGSGGIDAQGEQRGDWDLQTGSGSVHVDLPTGAAFDLDAHTGSGSIETLHAVTVQGSLERNRLSGKAGAGGPTLRVRTGSGGVRID